MPLPFLPLAMARAWQARLGLVHSSFSTRSGGRGVAVEKNNLPTLVASRRIRSVTGLDKPTTCGNLPVEKTHRWSSCLSAKWSGGDGECPNRKIKGRRGRHVAAYQLPASCEKSQEDEKETANDKTSPTAQTLSRRTLRGECFLFP